MGGISLNKKDEYKKARRRVVFILALSSFIMFIIDGRITLLDLIVSAIIIIFGLLVFRSYWMQSNPQDKEDKR